MLINIITTYECAGIKSGLNFVRSNVIEAVAVCAVALSNTIIGIGLPVPQHSGLTFSLHSSMNLLN